ncbi:autotransporter outer membrane beta-barrel domain-containing protein [Chryseobacterium chendengshani]|nr:hypothetical protein [Chryseobacterium sp. LJ668]MBW8524025.1 hypothetical protein [Chryseobacterium sp. LJ668]
MHAFSQTWNLSGNGGTTAGTNFLGTTDNQPIVFKVNNSEQVRLSANGRLVFYNNNGITYTNNLYVGGGNEIPSNNAGGVNFANTAVGLGAMSANSTGSSNTVLGFNSLASNSTGFGNTSLGVNAMQQSTTGNWNVAIGVNALHNLQSGEGNTAIGVGTMQGDGFVGTYNTSLGLDAVRDFHNGNYNTIIGARSLRSLSTGSNNIVLGYNNLSTYVLNNVNNNIFIGNNITPFNSHPNNELNIGNWIKGNNGTIGIGDFANQLPADGIAQDGEKYKLFVKDGIKTEKVKVDIAANNGWADYVFQKDYKLMPLHELDQFINKNGHLPEVPTTEEAIKNGIELKEMNILLLKKVEELTLHVIEQQKRIETLEKKIK